MDVAVVSIEAAVHQVDVVVVEGARFGGLFDEVHCLYRDLGVGLLVEAADSGRVVGTRQHGLVDVVEVGNLLHGVALSKSAGMMFPGNSLRMRGG